MVKEGVDFRITQMACDVDARKILEFTRSRPRSVKEISSICGIPLAKCYRRVKDMEEQGVLRRLEDRISKASLYSSNLRSLQISIEDDHLSLNIEFHDGTKRVFEFDASMIEENSAFA